MTQKEIDVVDQSGGGCCGGGCGGGSTNVKEEKVSSDSIVGAVREHYGNVAENANEGTNNCCGVPTKLYSEEELNDLTKQSVAASAGCGNPIGLGTLQQGEVVLDLGSGGGIDCFLAAKTVGDSGYVIGVDMTPQMVELARQNSSKMGYKNVEFKLGQIEAIPSQDASVDVVISNCVISLSEDKDQVFSEIYRVLKPGGRFVISDMVFGEKPTEELRTSIQSWVECVGGADVKEDYLARTKKAGFENLELLEERESASDELGESAKHAPKVLSITIKALKPL